MQIFIGVGMGMALAKQQATLQYKLSQGHGYEQSQHSSAIKNGDHSLLYNAGQLVVARSPQHFNSHGSSSDSHQNNPPRKLL
jgi:hypothetical protein